MAHNTEYLQTDIEAINTELFKRAILLAFEKITSHAPMGFSGDTVLLFGQTGPRRSYIGIRNHSGTAELLITDTKGTFLTLVKLDTNLGVDHVAAIFYAMFLIVQPYILTELPKGCALAAKRPDHTTPLTDGWELLKLLANSKTGAQ